MKGPDIDRPAPSRRREVLSGALAALVAAALVLFGLSARGSGQVAGAATATGTAAPTSSAGAGRTDAPAEDVTAAPVVPEPTGPTSDADDLPPSLPAVALHEQAAVDGAITAEVASLEPIHGTASGRGNVAGPALRATVRLHNGTAGPVALDFVTVRMTFGSEETPASPLDDPSRAPFTGTLAPGDTADGVYVFSAPEDQRDVVSLSVGYRAGAPYMVFTGPAS